jgi:hypothetical protein
MARRVVTIVAMFAVLMAGSSAARAHGAWHSGQGGHEGIEEHHETERYRSPGLAAALSLTPMPVDFGNFYAENATWGVAYTSVELGLMVPMLWIAGGHGMGHHSFYGSRDPWTSTDRNWMIGLVSGYVVVKVVAGLHAARAAESFNDRQQRISATIVPTSGGAAALAALHF